MSILNQLYQIHLRPFQCYEQKYCPALPIPTPAKSQTVSPPLYISRCRLGTSHNANYESYFCTMLHNFGFRVIIAMQGKRRRIGRAKATKIIICGYGGIGRHARFRFWCESVQVQVLLSAPDPYNPNPFPVGDGFGLLFFFDRYEDIHFRNGVRKQPTSKPRGPRKKKKNS